MNTIKPGQVLSLKTALRDCLPDDMDLPQVLIFIVSKLIGRQLVGLHHITAGEWLFLRETAYPRWKQGDWTVSNVFCIRVAEAYEAYMESIGQMRLF